jgi:hypothetical protein
MDAIPKLMSYHHEKKTLRDITQAHKVFNISGTLIIIQHLLYPMV